jgi:hypothetical protein
MAWTTINGHRYYRRSKRIGDKVVTRHVRGGARLGRMAEQLDAHDRLIRRMARLDERLDRELFEGGVRECFAVDDVLTDVFAVLAGRCGAYRHRRQWRWKRGGKAMAMKLNAAPAVTLMTIDRAAGSGTPALLPADLSGVPEADRATLRAAARGDAAALAASRKYLSDARYTRRWGDPMHAARCWLVTEASGTDRVVAAATFAHAQRMADDLGWQRATAVERLAIVRVVNNWLMVGILEVKACGLAAGSRERGRVEKALTQADRRLAHSLKALAFVQGKKTPPAVPRLPLASTTVPDDKR